MLLIIYFFFFLLGNCAPTTTTDASTSSPIGRNDSATVSETVKCSICLEELKEDVVQVCHNNHTFHEECIGKYIFLRLQFIKNSYIQSHMNANSHIQPRMNATCPLCRGELNPELMNKYSIITTASSVASDPVQCRIAYDAWIAMGGDQNEFPNPAEQCCGILGIECDGQGRITGLAWLSKGLSGRLYPGLGHLPQLIVLYEI